MAGAAMTVAHEQHGAIRRVVIDWLSDDSSGDVDGVTPQIIGTLLKAVTIPGADGEQPSDNYDITIKDAQGLDVLAPCVDDLADRSNTAAQQVQFVFSGGGDPELSIPVLPIVAEVLTIEIENAGNAKTGRLILYYRAA